jgi:hypothetical protein
MTLKSPLETTVVAERNYRRSKGNLPAFIFLGVILALGAGIAVLIIFFDIDNKVDVSNYPGSEKAALTVKGTRFIEDQYTSNKPSSDYYKVSLTGDSCETVLKYYRSETGKHGWTAQRQGDTASAGLVDTYSKNEKGLFVYCIPGSEQLAQDAGSKNLIILATADSVLKLSYP